MAWAAMGMFLLGVTPCSAQTGHQSRLHVTILDPSNAVIVSARLTLVRTDEMASPATALTGPTGDAEFPVTVGGLYRLRVEAEGFAPHVRVLRAGQGVTHHRVKLALASLSVSIDVTRSPQEAATDPRGLAFRRVLTEVDLAALPDDPQALEAALRAIAGPGAVFVVDGFEASRLPPKSAIQEVRISYSDFSAEYHTVTRAVVEILTKPGAETFRASVSVRGRQNAWSARDGFANERGDTGQQSWEGSLAGPLWPRRSSFLAMTSWTRLDVPQPVAAIGPAGPIRDMVVQRRRQLSVWAALAHALSASRTLRIRYVENRHNSEDAGAGALTLRERAFNSLASERTLQASVTGPIARRFYNQLRLETSFRKDEQSPVTPAPAVNVLGAFESGGAQVAGTRRQRIWRVEDDLDLAAKSHAIRLGMAVEGLAVSSNVWTNQLGTYTFATLADYMRGTPLAFVKRTGDPSLDLDVVRGAAYVQDDVRVARNLTISAGLRAEAHTAASRWNLAPRVSASWAPFPGGRTAVRIGVGRYYDWVQTSTLEQIERLNPARQRQVMVVFSDTGDAEPNALSRVGSPERYELSVPFRLPRHLRFLATVEQRLTQNSTVTISYQAMRTSRLPRGWNLNAPTDGVDRPDPAFGNIIQVQSVGRRTQHSLAGRLNWRAPTPLDLLVLADYALGRSRDDTDGDFAIPARPEALSEEWASSSQDARHQWSLTAIGFSRAVCHASLSASGATGTPYTIRSGRDDNRDGLIIERPAGIARNSARGSGYVLTNARVGCRLGRRPQAGPRHPVVELAVDGQNIFNRTNPVGYVGVVTSPLFGKPVGSLPARRIGIGLSVRF